MKLHLLPRTILIVCFAMLGMAHSSMAVLEHTYGPNEYVEINKGRSPNGKYFIAAHGTGEGSSDTFNLYLMDAATSKVIEAVPGIDRSNTRGTDAMGYDAKWSPDSSEVTISWSPERKAPLATANYRIKNGHISKVGSSK